VIRNPRRRRRRGPSRSRRAPRRRRRPRRRKRRQSQSNPEFVDELQSGLAQKLNAIPELPTYADPKLAEIVRKGFERGFGAGLSDAKLKATAVYLAAEVALALSGEAAILTQRAGAAALKGALARLKGMPVFIPGAIEGGGAFFRLPKPPIAQAARGEVSKKVPTPTLKGLGKVADEVPTSVPKNWSKADIEDAITDYELSIRMRKAEATDFDAKRGGGHLWSRQSHNKRIAQEEAFLKQLKRKLEDL
jgi:hypothetical protein